MDEVVWIIIGVIGVILLFGIAAKLYMSSQGDDQRQSALVAIAALSDHCATMCGTPPDTYLPVTVRIPSGIVLTTQGNDICVRYADTLSCKPCRCALNPYTLDLNNSDARKLFVTHDYRCYFLRGVNITVECKG